MNEPQTAFTDSPHRARWLIYVGGSLILGASVFAVYWPAMRGPFIFDDSTAIVENRSIREIWPLVGNEGPGPLNPPPATPVSGRPLVNLSFAVNYHFGQLDPFGYRVSHLVVHVLSAMLLWAIVARTLGSDRFGGKFDRVAVPLSFAAALAWALHPVNTESVVYLTQRTELLMGMFYVATLYFSIGYWDARAPAARIAYLMLATLTCVLGMLCKEMIASAPAMVLLYERTFITGSLRRILRNSWPLYVGLSLGWVLAFALHYFGWRTPGGGFDVGIPAHEWWLTQSRVVFLYLRLAIWPWPLVIHYEFLNLNTLAAAWPWLLATTLLWLGTLWLVWRRSAVGYVAIWFFAVLSPTLLIPLPAETAVERRMYIPLAALMPLFIVGGYALLDRIWHFRKPGTSRGRGPLALFAAATIALVIGYGFLCSRRLVAYQDELVLWQDALVHQPHNPAVWINIGTQLVKLDQLPDAIVHFEEAVRLDPDSYLAHYNLARALEASAQPLRAIDRYRMTLKLRPKDAATHYNLARLLEDSGDTRRAAKHYREAIAAYPDFSAAYTNLGVLLQNEGRWDEAIENFEAALRLEEDLSNYMNLILAYSQVERTSEAVVQCEKALDLAREDGNRQVEDRFEAALAYLRSRSN